MSKRNNIFGSYLGFNVGDINGLSLWITATDESTLTKPTNYVSSWIDKSINAFNFAQASAAKYPFYNASNPSVEFDGVDDFLSDPTNDAFISDQTGIIFFSGYAIGVSGIFIASGDTATTIRHINLGIRTTGEIYMQVRSGSLNDTVTSTNQVAIGDYFYGYIKSDGSTITMNLNGVDEVVQVLSGLNRGRWFNAVVNRNNLSIGALVYNTTIVNSPKVNKIVYTNDHTVDVTPILNYMSNPLN